MEAIKEYLVAITSAALICGLVNALAGGKSTTAKLLRLLCGLFMAATVMKPLVDIQITDIRSFVDQLTVDADLAVMNGEEIASNEMKRIIKEKTETYILDKAKTLGAELEVDVTLDGVIPTAVTLKGNISPFAKASLCETIARDLGIALEEQIWS
jgi:hypothetical protein